jgi:NAD(P)-dependent dehydrogenase (short-subunit alcohol dehydrogenase family)
VGWLDGQVALVTGGGSGIGRAVVARFIAEGARVGVLDRVPDRAGELKTEFGDAVVTVTGDVAQLADNKRAVAETVAALGRLDVLVGNAGVFDGFVSLADFPEATLSTACDELFGVNVKGCILGAKAALPELMKTDGLQTCGRRSDPPTCLGAWTTYPGKRRCARRHDHRSARPHGAAPTGAFAFCRP